MEKVLWGSSNGKWQIIFKTTVAFPAGFIMVTDGWYCDYPIMYDNGNIAYDYPERIPQYVKDAVKKVMRSEFDS